MMIVLLIVAALAAFGALMLALLKGLPRETLDEQAEAIRRDAEERVRKHREREARRGRKKHG